VNDDHQPAGGADQAGGAECPVRWVIDDVGRYLAGPDADPRDVASTGREAVTRGATDVHDLLHSAYGAHEVVATEVRFAGPERGFRRTVFALAPSPVALMLLCTCTCDPGEDVIVMQHTAGCGSSTRSASWPFGMARAEALTRPPARGCAPALPDGLDDLATD